MSCPIFSHIDNKTRKKGANEARMKSKKQQSLKKSSRKGSWD